MYFGMASSLQAHTEKKQQQKKAFVILVQNYIQSVNVEIKEIILRVYL